MATLSPMCSKSTSRTFSAPRTTSSLANSGLSSRATQRKPTCASTGTSFLRHVAAAEDVDLAGGVYLLDVEVAPPPHGGAGGGGLMSCRVHSGASQAEEALRRRPEAQPPARGDLREQPEVLAAGEAALRLLRNGQDMLVPGRYVAEIHVHGPPQIMPRSCTSFFVREKSCSPLRFSSSTRFASCSDLYSTAPPRYSAADAPAAH